MRHIALICGLLLMLTTSAVAQRKPKEPSNKAGAIHYTQSGSTYTLKDNSTSLSVSASDTIVGAAFFYERLFKSKFSAGLQYSSFLERSIEFSIGTNELNVVEATALTIIDFKAFFKDHSRPGFKPYIGVGFGQYTMASTISTTDSTGSTSDSTTEAVVPVTILNLGADYFRDFGGFRLNVGVVSGKRNDLTSNDTYQATYQATGVVFGISVYSLF